MSNFMKITIETHVPAPPDLAWRAYTAPDAITAWNFASPDWCCPSAKVDLRMGGAHCARMEVRDGSVGFDFEGVTERPDPASDGRAARTTFEPVAAGTRVRTVFDPETENPAEMQRDGWQAILDSYAADVRENWA
ncbi:MAG: activator of HSP90 ATPase [Rhodospirillales bacterium]|nr:activator of HSP90 ATPase [Rhodospirillales bacterium]